MHRADREDRYQGQTGLFLTGHIRHLFMNSDRKTTDQHPYKYSQGDRIRQIMI